MLQFCCTGLTMLPTPLPLLGLPILETLGKEWHFLSFRDKTGESLGKKGAPCHATK